MSSNKYIYQVAKRKQDDFIFCCMIGQCGIVTECNTKKKKKKFAWRGTFKFSKNTYQQMKLMSKVHRKFLWVHLAEQRRWRFDNASVRFQKMFTTHVMICFLAGPALSQTIGQKMMLSRTLEKFDASKKNSGKQNQRIFSTDKRIRAWKWLLCWNICLFAL